MSREFADIHSLIAEVAKDYQVKQTLSIPDWVVDLWHKMWQLIGRVLSMLLSKIIEWLGRFGISFENGSDSGRLLVTIVLTLIFSFVFGFFILRYRHWLKNWQNPGDITGGGINGQPLTSIEWRAQAAEFNQRGQFRQACRALHRACLQMLDETDLIAFAPARSNYEYVIALARAPGLANIQSSQILRKTFQNFSNKVDAVYFGNLSAGESEFEFCLKCLQEIENKINTLK